MTPRWSANSPPKTCPTDPSHHLRQRCISIIRLYTTPRNREAQLRHLKGEEQTLWTPSTRPSRLITRIHRVNPHPGLFRHIPYHPQYHAQASTVPRTPPFHPPTSIPLSQPPKRGQWPRPPPSGKTRALHHPARSSPPANSCLTPRPAAPAVSGSSLASWARRLPAASTSPH